MSSDVPEDVAEQYRRLNERFYAASPARYFEHRLNNLLVTAASDVELGPQLREGIDICGERMVVGDEERIDSDMESEELSRFVTAESLVLLSHTAEAVLRLFLAHEGQPACPWLDMSRLPFRDFWKHVRIRFVDPIREERLHAVVADVALGSPTYSENFPGDQDDWDATVERLTSWLRYLTRQMIDNQPAYNAAKHGFGARPDQAFIQFIDDASGKSFLNHGGPSIEVLTHGPWDDGSRAWVIKTIWLNPVHLWAVTGTAISMMESIWGFGRARFLGGAEVNMFRPAHTPGDIEKATGLRGVNTFSVNLFAEHKERVSGDTG